MDDFIKKIPLFSALLIAAGFINVYGYYSHFQIDIYSYLTSGELILSFLPVIVPVFLAILLLFFYLFQQKDKYDDEVRENSFLADKDLTIWGPFKDLVKLVKKRFKTKDKKRDVWCHFIIHISSRLIILTLFFGITYIHIYALIKKQGFPINQPVSFFFLSIIWLLIFSSQIQKYFEKRYSEISNFMKQASIIVGFLVMIYLFNSYKAFNVLENRPSHEIEIIQNNLKIKTDSNLIYIGKTKEYYFLRDLKERKNLIVNDKNIDLIYLKPINRN